MRRLLRVPEGPATAGEDSAHRIFSTSMVLSGLRCLLSYVVFPIVSPALGVATGVGPAIGIPIGVVALVFDVVGIRRFWLANHRWRWGISFIYMLVIVLVGGLVIADIFHLAG